MPCFSSPLVRDDRLLFMTGVPEYCTPSLSFRETAKRLHGMQHFHAQQIEPGTTEHLALQKFEPIDMSLCDADTFKPGASSVHSGIIPQDAIGKTLEVGDMTLFRSLQP